MSSEQERYSLDEMMDRLKDRQTANPEQGELVTREDGTQAIRVRKRKRRSHQPAKAGSEASVRSRLIQLSAALSLLIVALFVAGAAIVYSNSSPFREKLASNIAAATGAKAELLQFRMNPTGANATELHLAWPEGNILDSLRLSSLRASTHPLSFTGRIFTGDEVTAREGRLLLRVPSPGEATLAPETGKGNPRGIDFKRYSIRKLSIQLGSSLSSQTPRALNVEASFYAKHASGRPQLAVSRGDVHLPYFPPLKLFRGHIEFLDDEIDIVQLVLQNESNRQGVFSLSGKLEPYSTSGTSPLSVKLEQFQIEHLLGPQFGQFFSGSIETTESAKSNYLSFNRDEETGISPVFSAMFSNTVDSPFVIRGFPFLNSLRQLTEDPWFESPAFESLAKGELRKSGGETMLRDMNFGAKGRMLIRGSLSVSAGGVLSGDLHVGVADPVIGACSNAELLEAMFGPEKDDYRWITISLGGTVTAPSDTFRKQTDEARARLAAAASNPSTGGTPASSLPSFEDLTPSR